MPTWTPGRAGGEGGADLLGRAVAAGQPERAGRARRPWPGRRRREARRPAARARRAPRRLRGGALCPPARGALDDEAVRADRLVAREVAGQDVRRTRWPGSGAGAGAAASPPRTARGSKLQRRTAPRQPCDVARAIRADPSGRQVAQQPRDLPRHAGTHQHVVDAGEHRAVRGRRRGDLHLLQVVHARPARRGPPWPATPRRSCRATASSCRARLGRSVSLGTGRYGGRRRGRRDGSTWSRTRSASAGTGKCVQRAAYVAVRVAVLQPPRQDGVEGGAGHHAELPGACHRPGELPRRTRPPPCRPG